MRTLPADCGCNLRHLLRWTKPVEARHQRRLETRRNWRRSRRARRTGAGLDGRLGDLLGKQRQAVGSSHDLGARLRRQPTFADVVDESADLVARQPAERHRCDMGLADRRGPELRPADNDKQRTHGADRADESPHNLERRRVGPLGVFQHEENRPCAGKRLDLRDQRPHDHPPVALRGRLVWPLGVAMQRQQVRDQGRVLRRCRRPRPGEQGRELFALDRGGVPAREPCHVLHLPDNRVERAVATVRRAVVAQAQLGLVGHAAEELCREPRLADAGVARNNDNLPAAGLCGLPKLEQPRGLLRRPTKALSLAPCSASKRLSTALGARTVQALIGQSSP